MFITWEYCVNIVHFACTIYIYICSYYIIFVSTYSWQSCLMFKLFLIKLHVLHMYGIQMMTKIDVKFTIITHSKFTILPSLM